MTDLKTIAHSIDSKERTEDVLSTQQVSFGSMVLPSDILKGLEASGFETASPIQVKALPVGRCGFDLIVKSKSGTGKTLVFGIISLESIKLSKLCPQAVIVAPTREIAVQIQEVLQNIGRFLNGLTVECFIGGLPLEVDKEKCKSCHIAVGTPGRLKQLIHEGNLNVDSVKVFVLDEADKLTEESFQNDINVIYNSLPNRKQIIMCSATYPDKVKETLEHYLHSPVLVSVELTTPLLLGLKQYVRVLDSPSNVALQLKLKNDELLKIITSVSFVQCLVFSNYQSRAESVCNFLNRNGWNSVFMSAAQNQTQRLNSLSELKDFKRRILVSTDLISRGIDIANVDLVINYDIPMNASTYLHRMGRAGRFGSTGVCLNMAFNGQETTRLQNILGCIGGISMTITVVNDKYNFDCTEVLSAKLDENYNEEVKQIRTSLAEHSAKKDSKVKKTKKKKTEDDLEEVIEKHLQSDPSSVLSELASGSFDLPSTTSTVSDTSQVELLKKLAEGAVDTQELVSKKEIFCKNKALVSVAKMLSDVEVAKEDLQDISQYFSNLKSQETLVENFSATLENIFVLAYKSQISPQASKWQDLLSDQEKLKLSDNYQEEIEEESVQYDEDYDFEVEKDIEVNYEPEMTECKIMEWMPVEAGKEVLKPRKISRKTHNPNIAKEVIAKQATCSQIVDRESCDYNQKYGKYFQHCSDNLWQNGLTFNSVQSFDEWFYYDWERQLNAVGNFVQNKIYLEEMFRSQNT